MITLAQTNETLNFCSKNFLIFIASLVAYFSLLARCKLPRDGEKMHVSDINSTSQ